MFQGIEKGARDRLKMGFPLASRVLYGFGICSVLLHTMITIIVAFSRKSVVIGVGRKSG